MWGWQIANNIKIIPKKTELMGWMGLVYKFTRYTFKEKMWRSFKSYLGWIILTNHDWKSTYGIVHEWVDQFASQPKSLFTQNFGQILEITTSLH
jgi:hypothetical protein